MELFSDYTKREREMVERVKERLEEELAKSKGSNMPQVSEEEAARLRESIRIAGELNKLRERSNSSDSKKERDTKATTTNTNANANDYQVGGDHYRKVPGEQHWDRAVRLKFNFFQYMITRYVERYRDKNGIEDLHKAAHFLQKLIEVEATDVQGNVIDKVNQERKDDDDYDILVNNRCPVQTDGQHKS